MLTKQETMRQDESNERSRNQRLRRAEAILAKVRLKEGEEPLTEKEIIEECRAVRQERYAKHHAQSA